MKFQLSMIGAALCAAAAAMPSFAKDGVYTTTTLGRNGDVKVQTTIENGKIKDVKVLEWSETYPIADLPGQKIPADIVKFQTTNVDIVSGATLTSFAIRAAVEEALTQAGLDPKNFSKAAPKPAASTALVKQTGDVVIIGGGGAGISAAVAAAEKGKNVILIEKTHFIGGDTCVSGGGYNAADPALESKHDMTPGQKELIEQFCSEKPRSELHAKLIKMVKQQWADFQKNNGKGLFDTPEFHAIQTWAAGDYAADLEKVYKLCRMSPGTLKYLADIGLKWDDHTTQYVGAPSGRALTRRATSSPALASSIPISRSSRKRSFR